MPMETNLLGTTASTKQKRDFFNVTIGLDFFFVYKYDVLCFNKFVIDRTFCQLLSENPYCTKPICLPITLGTQGKNIFDSKDQIRT
jgi:hypothetical protein